MDILEGLDFLGGVWGAQFATPVGVVLDFLGGPAPYFHPVGFVGPVSQEHWAARELAQTVATCRWWRDAWEAWGEGP